MTNDALLPCPFCGERLQWHEDIHGQKCWRHTVDPDRECAHGNVQLYDADDIACWNTRAQADAPALATMGGGVLAIAVAGLNTIINGPWPAWVDSPETQTRFDAAVAIEALRAVDAALLATPGAVAAPREPSGEITTAMLDAGFAAIEKQYSGDPLDDTVQKVTAVYHAMRLARLTPDKADGGTV